MYCSVEDMRSAGVTAEQAGDERLTELITLSCDYIDRVTGQFFEPREKMIEIDGSGGSVLPLPAFCISTDLVILDGRTLAPSAYVLYNRESDRAYPKIALNPQNKEVTVWTKGLLNVGVNGFWGWSETPPLIRRAAMKLALYNFPDITDADAVAERNTQGALIRETTDGHSYELSESVLKAQSDGTLTGDAEIDGILKRFMFHRLAIGAA